MMSGSAKMFVLVLMILALGSLVLAACARPGTQPSTTGSSSSSSSSSSTGSGGETRVTMNGANFDQQSVTISKGSTITLANSSSVAHIIANGTWASGTAKPAMEAGAPKVDNAVLSAGQNLKVGPFNTAGTFQLYCSVHQGMNLTVIVQ